MSPVSDRIWPVIEHSGPGQEHYEDVLTGEFDTTAGPASFARTFTNPGLERPRRLQFLVLWRRQRRDDHGRAAGQSGSNHR